MDPMLKTLVHCTVVLLIGLSRAEGQTPSPCQNQNVHYRSDPKSIEKKIHVTRSVSFTMTPTSTKRVTSPQGTRWFVEVDPDYMSSKTPWSTTLHIGSTGSDKGFLEASFTDHGNTFAAHWINEKLLFVQVWWGRLASSDLILDVDSGRFIHDEFAHYGELVEPCR